MNSRVPVVSARYGRTLGTVLVHESLLRGQEVVFALRDSLCIAYFADRDGPVPVMGPPTARLRRVEIYPDWRAGIFGKAVLALQAPTGCPLALIPGFEPH